MTRSVTQALRHHLDIGRISGLFIHMVVVVAIGITITHFADGLAGYIISAAVIMPYLFLMMVFTNMHSVFRDYGQSGAPQCSGGCRWQNSNIVIGGSYTLYYCSHCSMYKALASDGTIEKCWRCET